MANSVLYSPDDMPAKDLQSVISRLGVDLVRTTVLGIAVGQMLRSKDIAVFSNMAQAQCDHSLRTAAAERVLARRHSKIPPDEALLAGLLHHLGAFYMLYRAVQYPELHIRQDTVKFLIVGWHESIGVTLLNALGMSENIVEAFIDHDQPRPLPETIRTLADVVYLGNILTGTHRAWSEEAGDALLGEVDLVRERYADLLPEIEADTQAMLDVFP